MTCEGGILFAPKNYILWSCKENEKDIAHNKFRFKGIQRNDRVLLKDVGKDVEEIYRNNADNQISIDGKLNEKVLKTLADLLFYEGAIKII